MIAALLSREGGYVNDPKDAGGETKFGISKRQFPHLNIKDLTPEQAAEIYRQRYFVGPKIDQLPAELHPQMLDFAVHSGQMVAIQKLQLALGIEAVGVIGPETIGFAAACDSRFANNRLMAERIKMIANLVAKNPSQVKFLRGWMSRCLEFLL